MKKEDLKNDTIENLKRSLKEVQKELLDLRVQNELRKLKNVKSLNAKRKEMARILTFIREKEINNAG